MYNRKLIETFIIFIIFYIIDKLYLQIMSEKIQKQIITIQKTPIQTKPIGSLIINILLILSIYIFIVSPNAPLIKAFILGIVVQGTMASTNLTVFKNWTYELTIIDTIAGGLTTLLATYFGRVLLRFI